MGTITTTSQVSYSSEIDILTVDQALHTEFILYFCTS